MKVLFFYASALLTTPIVISYNNINGSDTIVIVKISVLGVIIADITIMITIATFLYSFNNPDFMIPVFPKK